jgi:hypothetical protein
MSGHIDGAVAKLSRSYLQLIELQRDAESIFPSTRLWPLTVEERRPGLEYFLHLGQIPAIDPDWTLIASEILFNIRCSLDYLVYELHVRHFRGTPPADVAKNSIFPVSFSQSKFPPRRIDKLAKKDQRAIRHLQPYVARKDGWEFTRMALGQLHALQNIDKHRRLHIVAAAQAGVFSYSYPPSCGFTLEHSSGPVESGGHVQTYTFASPPPEVKFAEGVILAAALEHDGQMMSLLGTLSELTNQVTLIVERFSDRFPAVPRPTAWRPDRWASPIREKVRPRPSRSLFTN